MTSSDPTSDVTLPFETSTVTGGHAWPLTTITTVATDGASVTWPGELLTEVREAWDYASTTLNVRWSTLWGDTVDLTVDVITELVAYDVDSTNGKWAPGQTIGSELDMVVLARTHHTDRFVFIAANNDYTGWGCEGDRARVRYGDYDDVVRYGMGDEDRRRLGIEVTVP